MVDKADSILAQVLPQHGFAVIRKFTSSPTCSIFLVRAADDPGEDVFAAKVVHLSGLDSRGRASAEQEVSFLKGISAHPNLIAYRDSFAQDLGPKNPSLIIIMSFAEDGDLRGAVKESAALQRSIPEPVARSWLRQLLLGLRHMHTQAVIHRDLKSSNVFLSRKRQHLCVGDFGISTCLDSVSFANSSVGTPAYMAPEVMQGEKYEFQADMWSVGCIAFELCALCVPFKASTLMELFNQVTVEDPDWSLWKGFSDELRDVTQRLLQKEPSKRPTSSTLLEEACFSRADEVPAELWALVAPALGKDVVEVPAKAKDGLPHASCGGISNQSTTIGSEMSAEKTSRLDDACAN